MRRHPRLRRCARNLRQLLNFLIDLAEYALRPNTNLLEHRRHDAFFVLDQRSQQMHRQQLRIAVLGREFVRALDGLLRFYGEFVPTDYHNFNPAF